MTRYSSKAHKRVIYQVEHIAGQNRIYGKAQSALHVGQACEAIVSQDCLLQLAQFLCACVAYHHMVLPRWVVHRIERYHLRSMLHNDSQQMVYVRVSNKV